MMKRYFVRGEKFPNVIKLKTETVMNPSFEKYVALLLLALFFFASPISAQSSPFKTPDARHDSIQAYQMLRQAHLYYDSSNTAMSTKLANGAADILLRHADADSPWLTDAYCLQGLSLLKKERGTAFALWRKVEALPPSQNVLTQANALFFIGSCQLYSGQTNPAKESYQSALQLFLSLPEPPSTFVGRIYSNSGYMAANEGKTKEAIELYEKSIAFFTKYKGEHFPVAAHPYNNRGLIYWTEGKHPLALADLNTALKIRTQFLPPDDPEIAVTLNNLGLVSLEKGALEEAQAYFVAAIHIFQTAKDSLSWAAAANNLGIICQRLLNPSEARRHYEITLAVEESKPFAKKSEIASSLFNIGVSLREEGDFDQALQYFEKAKKVAGTKHAQYPRMLSAIGRCQEAKGQHQEALENYEGAYQAQLQRYGTDNPLLATFLFNKANVMGVRGEYAEALLLNRQAQQLLGYREARKFSDVFLLFDLCAILTQESLLLLRVAGADANGLGKALASAQNALLAYTYFSRTNAEPPVQLVAKAAALKATEVAIASNYALFGITGNIQYAYAAFHHSEHVKSTLLLESMQAEVLLQKRAKPELQNQLQFLKTAIAQKDIFIQERLAKKANPLDSSLIQAAMQRSALISEYDALFSDIIKAQDFPAARTIGVKVLQDSLLSTSQTLLEYFVGEQKLYVFLIQPKKFEIFELPLKTPLEPWVDSLHRGITGYYSLKQTQRTVPLQPLINQYTDAAQVLYQQLLLPFDSLLSEELVIIPDGVLGYIPFEALLSKRPGRYGNFKTYDFLLQKHRISYGLSATLWHRMCNLQHLNLPGLPLLAMAPFSEAEPALRFSQANPAGIQVPATPRDSLLPLRFSREEVQSIAESWQGKVLYGSEATIPAFLAEAPNHAVIHFSTHAKADNRMGNYAYLAMSSSNDPGSYNKLYARDLYNLNLNANMVVLSACETARGKLQMGEGIASLARAFAHAGAKSIVTTLWSVEEQPTQAIMVEFYRNMKDGKTKDTALQQTKLAYLTEKARENVAEMHPFFWAGFIGIGDMRSLR